MGEELTLEILDEAIEKIRALEKDNEIIGFKINPADLRDIEMNTSRLVVLGNNNLMMVPPYKGLMLVADTSIVTTRYEMTSLE